jgi:dienelactone hydrolase
MLLPAMLAGCAGTLLEKGERLDVPREHRGERIEVRGDLLLPPGSEKVPAMVIHHGSGGVTEAREYRYARELVGMGVAVLVIDSFTPRGISSTVSAQAQISTFEMTDDALAALKALAAHPRIDASRTGVVGFSKGGTSALQAALERRAARILPTGVRYALHVAFYPACNNHLYRPELSGGPMLMLLGGADTYTGVEPCIELAAIFRSAGADVTLSVYPGAPHGFDGEAAYSIASGENWRRCIFEEQPDGNWTERITGEVTTDARGRRNPEGLRRALAACLRRGVSGGPDADARDASMADLKAAVRRHLLSE